MISLSTKKVLVPLKENSYQVFIGSSILSILPDEIKRRNLNKNLIIAVDGNVWYYHQEKIKNLFTQIACKIFFYIVPPGEKSKSYLELNEFYTHLLNNGFGRDTLIIGIGGGVIGDLIGFATATFMRGVQLVHIPTTLLASVDSSIGGKTGINFGKRKNIIGAFYQPKAVFIDTDFLDTLPLEEKISGLGEVIKYAFLSDYDLFNFVEKKFNSLFDKKIIQEIILKSVSIKAAIVAQDEKESSLRKILNFGHTFAHAFESEMNFRVKHGEAVVAGMIAALFLSNELNLLSNQNLEKFLSLPLKIKLPLKFASMNKGNIYDIMHSDKKSSSGKINFVLISDIGNILLDVHANKKEIFNALQKTEDAIHKNLIKPL